MNDYTYRINNRSPKEKKRFIRAMFDTIVPTYDLLNRVLSLGTDIVWRRNMLARLSRTQGAEIMDIACGTGDLTRMLNKRGAAVTSLDFSLPMLRRGLRKKALTGSVVAGDACALPLRGNRFDAVVIAFGIRNIPDIDNFLDEARRVLVPGGELVILELTRPASKTVAFFYSFYLHRLLPLIGGLVSGEKEAYRYLAETISTFIEPRDLTALLQNHGFVRTAVFRQWPGVAAVITAVKEEA